MAENEVWFRHKPGLVTVGLPVHWKGWVVGTLYALALLAVIFTAQSVAEDFGRDDLVFVVLVGVVAASALTLAFVLVAWPHRGEPDGGR